MKGILFTQSVAFVTACVLNLKAQNLVSNPSFEDTVPCAGWNVSKLPCLPWKKAGGTPDYFSEAWCYPWGYAPSNAFGYQQAHSGYAYCGFLVYDRQAINAREYVQCSLTSPLIPGNLYYASFYVSLGDAEKFGADRIGAYFSIDSIHTPGYCYCTINQVPQVENDSGNIITDTMSWTLIDGYFYAVGGEQYITIGNFKKDNKTLLDSLPWGTDAEAYYYIDDVSVIDCTATGINENNIIKFQFTENPANSFLRWVTSERITKSYIYDLTGKLIQSDDFQQMQSTYRVNVAYLRQGMYLLIVEDKNKRRGVRKFIKN